MEVLNLDFRKLLASLAKFTILWGPVVVGIIHQLRMYLFGIDYIYVFVEPPGYLCPFVSLEYQWWFVLLVFTTLAGLLVYSDRLQSVPRRLALPFYLYVLFLLIFVKPV